ncbi:MAG: isopeptide-forming domain-containing fimbrial protein [Bifidobacterium aquikefiri]|uniref:Fimbrial isopeptide formation D2 domain-containing protein n=1 Tax=Bifidobacterium aquikefiri TaxID=1653207 RepID=A0A261G2W4_9BIFI|nr:isopeptide-forming domain-containing fimbrial protein [Bifidobacterium aquikefiri]OZG65774.1 fimbrial isopeptide formation D2 domain-containing protein [Bifidobacterium aquikefiri]
MFTKRSVKRVTGIAVAASLALAGLAFTNTAQADTTNATITVNQNEEASGTSLKAYLIGEYESTKFDAAGDLDGVTIKAHSNTNALADLVAAAKAAGADAALDETNPLGWVAANWLGYSSTPLTDDTASAVTPYAGKLQLFAQSLAAEVNETDYVEKSPTGSGPWEFTGLTTGLYLIVDSNSDAAAKSLPIIVGTKAWNATTEKFVDFADVGQGAKPALGVATLKNDTSIVSKTIVGGGKGFNIGDTVDYEITFKVPSVTADQTSWNSTIVDTFPAALDPPTAASIKIFVGTSTVDVADRLPENSITYDASTGKVLTIKGLETLYAFANSENEDKWENLSKVPGRDDNIPVKAGDLIRITYTATINNQAVGTYATDNATSNDANKNTVTYEDPTTTSTNDGDTAEFATFGINLEKVDKADNVVKLADATFNVKRAGKASNLKFYWTSGDTYRLATPAEITANANIVEDVKSVASTGVFKIYGVAAGEFVFTEKAAPTDYYKIPEFTVQINPSFDVNTETLASVAYELDGTSNTWLTANDTVVTVGNTLKTLANLPYTGGIGIALFLIVGTIVTIIGLRAHRQSAKAENAAAAV